MIQDTGQILANSVGHWQAPDTFTTIAAIVFMAIGLIYINIKKHKNVQPFHTEA